VKILDRYIASSIAAAFLSGVMVFMVLLCAIDLFKGFIELVTKYGVEPGVAFSIFAYKIPGMLVFAFPMAVLLGILLVFSRMSAESEMVAMRAGGVSFVRITIPVMIFSLLITGLTFIISNYYAPYASKCSEELRLVALKQAKGESHLYLQKDRDNKNILYTLQTGRLDVSDTGAVMHDVSVLYFKNGAPDLLVYAPRAEWVERRYWKFYGGYVKPLGRDAAEISMQGKDSSFTLELGYQLTVSPILLKNDTKDPADLTSDDIRLQVREMIAAGKGTPHDLGQWLTRLDQRFSTPFACLVFALIGAPLGLRHHRTSSAVGFGISLLVIFAFYFVNVYVTSFGDNGTIPPAVSAWTPNVLGAILGIFLLLRANR